MQTIYESAKDTAKKIRKVLKESFPETKFSVTSDRDSVTVHWTDGAMKPDVEAILKRFESKGPSDMSDYRPITGYVLDGQRYVGAEYLSASRSLTPDYKAQIIAQAQALGMTPDVYGDYRVYQLNEAERTMLGVSHRLVSVRVLTDNLVDSFLLDRGEIGDVVGKVREHYPMLKRFSYQIEEEPAVSVDLMEKPEAASNVIEFNKKRVDRLFGSLTPEQRLKMAVITKIVGTEEAAYGLSSGVSVDEMFKLVAEIHDSLGKEFLL